VPYYPTKSGFIYRRNLDPKCIVESPIEGPSRHRAESLCLRTSHDPGHLWQ